MGPRVSEIRSENVKYGKKSGGRVGSRGKGTKDQNQPPQREKQEHQIFQKCKLLI